MNLRTGLRAYMQKHKHLCNERMPEVQLKVKRSLWQVRCMGNWYFVGGSRTSQYAFAKSLEVLILGRDG